MSWFKTDAAAVPPTLPTPEKLPPDVPLTSFGQGLSAGFQTMWRNQDGASLNARETEDETKKLRDAIVDRLGKDRVRALYNQKGFFNPEVGMGLHPVTPLVTDALLDAARQDAEINPGKWKDLDLSKEGITARVDARARQEDQENQQILAMSPHPVAEQFLGGVGAGVADPKQWPLLMVNPSGGIIRALGLQALLGAGSALTNLPAEERIAKQLGHEAPDWLTELGMGAVTGMAFEGIARGLKGASKVPALWRGLAYYKEVTKPVPGDHIIDAAEAALQADKPVAEAIAPLVAEQPPAAALPPREPLMLTSQQRVDNPIGQPRDPQYPDPEPVAPVAEEVPSVVEAITTPVEGESANLDAAVAADTKSGKPLMQWLKSGQQPNARSAAKAAREGRALPGYVPENDLRIDPNGTLGRELKAQDITPKSHPGIWRKGGRDTLDNIPASEMENQFPGIIDATKSSREPGAYLDRDGLAALLVRDANGDKSWLQSHQDVMRASDSLDEVQRAASGESAAESAPEPETGWEVNPGMYDFDNPNGAADLERDLNEYMDTQWSGQKLTANEREQFISHMKREGGNAEDAMVSILSRDIDLAETKGAKAHDEIHDPAWEEHLNEVFGPRLSEAGGSGAVGPDELPHADGGGAAGEGDGYSVEATPIGDQYLVPGTERAQTANKDAALIALKQQQSKLRRPDQVRVEDDANGLFAAPDLDLFDDMLSPKARSLIDQSVAYMKSLPDQGFGVDDPAGLVTDEGKRLASVQDILDEFDEMDRMESEFEACMTKGEADGA